MTRAILALAVFVGFFVLATANSGGYRYGVSDQAFYIPAISLRADPTLFPRDRAVFEPQMRLWVGDELLGGLVRRTGLSLPLLFGGLYVLTMIVVGAGATVLARTLGAGWPAATLALCVMTLRHRIAKTGANSLEGYMHPRMLAFGIGLFVMAAVVRRRWASALALVVVAAVVHTSTAIWFGAIVVLAFAWQRPRRTSTVAVLATLAALAAIACPVAFPDAFPRMDAPWLAVLASRDYLFSLHWPLSAWGQTLAYVVLLALILQRRRMLGVATAGEHGLLAGLFGLVALFVLTLPAAEMGVEVFVTLQANRVFWLLDVAFAILGAWWVMEDLPRFTHRRAGAAVAMAVALLAVARGGYILRVETGRALIQAELPDTTWTQTMRWLSTQPRDLHVLVDPDHVWKFGSSVRVAAFRDTYLELGKDPAMAMYDRALARRVAERQAALGAFEALTMADVRRLRTVYGVDVLIDQTWRRFDLPELFRNADFVAYDLR